MRSTPTDYSITTVPIPVSDELRREVAAFWLQNGAIPNHNEALRRADELVCMARNRGNEIVGVNTAYLSNLHTSNDRYYLYRMFLRPPDRHLHLTRAMVLAAVDALRARQRAGVDILGVALETENQKLMRESGRRLLTSLGWQPSGKNARGLDVWTIKFEQPPTG